MDNNCNCTGMQVGMSTGMSSVFYQDPRFEIFKAIISGWAARSNSVVFETASEMADKAWQVLCEKNGIKYK